MSKNKSPSRSYSSSDEESNETYYDDRYQEIKTHKPEYYKAKIIKNEGDKKYIKLTINKYKKWYDQNYEQYTDWYFKNQKEIVFPLPLNYKTINSYFMKRYMKDNKYYNEREYDFSDYIINNNTYYINNQDTSTFIKYKIVDAITYTEQQYFQLKSNIIIKKTFETIDQVKNLSKTKKELIEINLKEKQQLREEEEKLKNLEKDIQQLKLDNLVLIEEKEKIKKQIKSKIKDELNKYQ